MKNFNKCISASAPGKCILFGEHAVVYGHPAIALGINLRSRCRIEEISDDKIELNLKNFNKYFKFKNFTQFINDIPAEFSHIKNGVQMISKLIENPIKKIRITLSSSIIPASGLGSSASIAVAMISAFNEFYQLNLNKSKISEFAFEMEKFIHLTPSGIDNTTCTFGNIIYFKKKRFELLNIPEDFHIILTYTGIEHQTSQAITKIKKIITKYPEITDQIFSSIGKITDKARIELTKNNFINVGLLMKINQGLLSALGVSNSIISQINDIALNAGAFGSKLTGAGLGGHVISIGTDLKKIAKELNKNGFKTFIVKIDRIGAKIDEQ
ncbi:MAG: mevalonate kinase [Candidatus Helarchaeota archaeon]